MESAAFEYITALYTVVALLVPLCFFPICVLVILYSTFSAEETIVDKPDDDTTTSHILCCYTCTGASSSSGSSSRLSRRYVRNKDEITGRVCMSMDATNKGQLGLPSTGSRVGSGGWVGGSSALYTNLASDTANVTNNYT